nr:MULTISPECIES: hypothetical protein [Providencia]
MFGLFLMVCSAMNCQFEPYGYIYPDEINCLVDRELLVSEGKVAECYPVDAIIRANNWLSIISFIFYLLLAWCFLNDQTS